MRSIGPKNKDKSPHKKWYIKSKNKNQDISNFLQSLTTFREYHNLPSQIAQNLEQT